MSVARPVITDYLRANARGLLRTHAAGGHWPGKSWSEFRVTFTALWLSLSPVELAAWQRSSLTLREDKFGILAADVERLLESLELPPADPRPPACRLNPWERDALYAVARERSPQAELFA